MIKEGGCGSLGNYPDPAAANDTQRCLWTDGQQTLELDRAQVIGCAMDPDLSA